MGRQTTLLSSLISLFSLLDSTTFHGELKKVLPLMISKLKFKEVYTLMVPIYYKIEFIIEFHPLCKVFRGKFYSTRERVGEE